MLKIEKIPIMTHMLINIFFENYQTYTCSTADRFKPRSLFHFNTFTMSSSEYQPTFKSRVVLSFFVIDFSFSLINFSCEAALVATLRDAMVYHMLLGNFWHIIRYDLGIFEIGVVTWTHYIETIQNYHPLYCEYIVKVLTSKRRSLSKPHLWNSRAIDMWSPFFHCLWSHSGTPISPLALGPQSLRSFAFSAFSSSAKCLRVNQGFLVLRDIISIV